MLQFMDLGMKQTVKVLWRKRRVLRELVKEGQLVMQSGSPAIERKTWGKGRGKEKVKCDGSGCACRADDERRSGIQGRGKDDVQKLTFLMGNPVHDQKRWEGLSKEGRIKG